MTVDIVAEPFYTDAAQSVVDPAAVERNRAALKDVTSALGAIVAHGEAWASSATVSEAECTAAVIAFQAAGGALTGKTNSKQAAYERKWRTVGFAITYLMIRDRATPEQRAVTEPWLAKLADRIEADDQPPELRNNHHYWVGLAATAVGVATGDKARVARGRARFDAGLAAIQADGSLPKEMARRSKALHYHGFAATALVYSAAIAQRAGESWWDRSNGALHRLVARTSTGMADPAWFSTRAGVNVDPPRPIAACWAALYQRRFPGRITNPPQDAPCRDIMLGGDAQLIARAWMP